MIGRRGFLGLLGIPALDAESPQRADVLFEYNNENGNSGKMLLSSDEGAFMFSDIAGWNVYKGELPEKMHLINTHTHAHLYALTEENFKRFKILFDRWRAL